MTVDYTKISEQKTSRSVKASELTGKTGNTHMPEITKPLELAERICRQCYWIGRPRIIEHGSWLGYFLPMFFDEPEKLFGCRGCNHPNSMVPLDSHEGKQAFYWHNKQKNPSATPTQF